MLERQPELKHKTNIDDKKKNSAQKKCLYLWLMWPETHNISAPGSLSSDMLPCASCLMFLSGEHTSAACLTFAEPLFQAPQHKEPHVAWSTNSAFVPLNWSQSGRKAGEEKGEKE